MASEKLNQAFIKAYGKRKLPPNDHVQLGKLDSARRDELSSQQDDCLIVRFDTATVQSAVPLMHNPRPPREAMAMASTAGGPQAPSAGKSIAAQSSIPTSPPTERTEAKPVLIEPMGTESDLLGTALGSLDGADDWSSLFGSSMVIFPQASLGRPTDAPSNRKPIAPASSSVRVDYESNTSLQPIEPQTIDSQPIATTIAEPKSAEPASAAPTLVESTSLEPKTIQSEAHAEFASNSNTNERESIAVGILPSEPSTIQQQIAARNRGGDIVRLDRPNRSALTDVTYSRGKAQTTSTSELTNSPTGEPAHPESVQCESVPLESAIDEQPIPIDALPRQQKVLAAEEGLRRARKRIFNPLWEVDRLDWPRVSLELMAAIEDKSPGVAKNLSNACQDGLQILAVTSPVSGAGTSTVACCLAMLAGRHGMNIALVDGNLENPSLCYQTNLEIELDWHEAIDKRLPLEEVAVHSVDDQITMVPLLARLSAPQLNEQSIATVLQELSQSFDLVIVDLGPMASSKNMVSALGSLGILNAVVTVVDRRQPGTANIESCLRQIRMSGISSIGLVENFAA